jgi:hypothetical protein
MKYYSLIILFLSLTLSSCSQKQNTVNMENESPLAAVIKLDAAESFKDFDAARKFIDVEKVYEKTAKEENKSSEIIWKEFVEFNYAIGNSSVKFTSSFPFHKYKIIETINGNTSEVKLVGTESGQRIREIIYKLELQNKSWVVIAIDYKK